MEQALFGSALWHPALEKYAEVTGLTVELYGVDGEVVLASERVTPLLALFREYAVEPGLFAECAQRCLEQTTTRPAVTLAERHGLMVVGTSLILNGEIVGAAVAGYALAGFSQVAATQRWAASMRAPFGRLWQIVRQQAPVPERRLLLHGELLQVLGDALLRENYHTREHEDVAAKLRMAAAAKDQFLALLGHELRNPLSTVRNAILAARLDETQRDHALEIARRQSEHLAHLVDDLLDVARISEGKIRLQREQISLGDAVDRAVEEVRPFTAERGQTLSVSRSGAPIVDADPARLEQIFGNLLTNAAKYTPPGGRIAVVVEQRGGDAVLRVRDNGIGIVPELLPRIFDLFAQGETQLDRAQGGLGIGLTVARRLVELHGGRIAAHSQGRGTGAEFVVHLPALPVAVEDVSAPKPSRREPPMRSARVLIVEDNPDAAESLVMLLELLGHRVRAVHDGVAALDAARANAPDLMLIDIGLPGMDGYEVARRIRHDPAIKHLVLVALTGYGREEDKQHSVEAGFDYHLVKPVDLDALGDLVGRLGSRTHHRDEPSTLH